MSPNENMTSCEIKNDPRKRPWPRDDNKTSTATVGPAEIDETQWNRFDDNTESFIRNTAVD